MVLIRKKPPKFSKRLKKKLYMVVDKKPLKFNKKTRRKTEEFDQWKISKTWWRNEKKTRLFVVLYIYLWEVKTSQNLAKKNGEEI